jgi:FixJ family two-component response regulator
MLCAVRLNGTDGIELLRKVHARCPHVPIVMLTGVRVLAVPLQQCAKAPLIT